MNFYLHHNIIIVRKTKTYIFLHWIHSFLRITYNNQPNTTPPPLTKPLVTINTALQNAALSPSPERLQRCRHLSRNTHPPPLVGVDRSTNVVRRSDLAVEQNGGFTDRVVPVLRYWVVNAHGMESATFKRAAQIGTLGKTTKKRRDCPTSYPGPNCAPFVSVPPRSLRPCPKIRHGHRLGVPPTPSVPPRPWGVHLSISARGTARPRLVEGCNCYNTIGYFFMLCLVQRATPIMESVADLQARKRNAIVSHGMTRGVQPRSVSNRLHRHDATTITTANPCDTCTDCKAQEDGSNPVPPEGKACSWIPSQPHKRLTDNQMDRLAAQPCCTDYYLTSAVDNTSQAADGFAQVLKQNGQNGLVVWGQKALTFGNLNNYMGYNILLPAQQVRVPPHAV